MGERIAVLGAGPMGLAVAYELVLNGHHPVVFEADDRVGGMTATFDFSGIQIERFYHFHCTSDHALLDLLEELGLSEKMCWTRTKMGYWHQNRLQAWGNPIALLRFRGLGLVAKVRYGAHVYLATKRTDWEALDTVEASGWIKRWVGPEAFDVLWRRLFEYKFYHYSEQLSAAWIWSRIRRIGRSRYNIWHEKLGYLDGGSETLLSSLKATIEEKGGEIRLSSPVDEVILAHGRVTGVRHASGTIEAFDKVVSTVPLPYVPRIIPSLPSKYLDAYRSVKNIAVVCVIAKLARPVSENFWLNINDPDMDIPGLVEYTNLRSLSSHIIYVPFYMPADNPKYSDSDEVFIDKVRAYIKKINPDITDDDVIEMRASRYRFAQPVCEPGFLQRLPPVDLPIMGLWVADTSYYYPEDRGISESVELGRKLAAMASV